MIVDRPAASCTVTIDGRTGAIKDMAAAIGTAAAKRPRIVIHPEAGTPYRCIGGVVYTLQAAGVGSIKVVNAPRSRDRR